MTDILTDPIWQLVAVLLAVVAIVVSIVLFMLQRKRKTLSFEILTDSPLLRVGKEVKERVQILLDGKPVKDVRLVVIKFENSGNVPILIADFVQPLAVNFGDKSQVLSAEIIRARPRNVAASVESRENGVNIKPTLLNQRDSFTVKVLVSESEDRVGVDGRIVGVKEIREASKGLQRESFIALVQIGTLLVAMVAVLLSVSSVLYPLVAAAIAATVGFTLVAVSRSRSSHRK